MRGDHKKIKVYWFGGVYPSMAYLARQLGVTRQAISHAFRHGQKVKGFKIEKI